jgi:signal transduction histidine kinase
VCEWPDELGEVDMDPVLMAQVLASLMSNAAEASSAGQTITLYARRQGSLVRIVVADQGSGIASHHQAQAGRPFFTTKAQGLGMGLPLARRAAERAGGTLQLESEPGAGCSAILTLPVLPSESPKPSPSATPLAPTP